MRSRSNVGVKVIGQGQRSRSNFGRAAVDIRGSALPSAAKSNKSHYQRKVFVCVSVNRGRIWIIARMRSIGVLIYKITDHGQVGKVYIHFFRQDADGLLKLASMFGVKDYN